MSSVKSPPSELNLLLSLNFVIIAIVQAARAQSFYSCNYNGQSEPSEGQTPQQVTFSIEGNPSYYTPEKAYHVTVTSDSPFLYLGITSVIASTPTSQTALSAAGSETSYLCGHIHSVVSPTPITENNFYWTAPPSGSGCVNIVVTALMGHQILYHDLNVRQICEIGVGNSPPLLDLNQAGTIFRDNFNSGTFGSLWSSERSGVNVSQRCGEIMFGDAAYFCDVTTRNKFLQTKPLNLTTAATIQWSIGSGSCQGSGNHLKLSYRHQGEDDPWVVFKSVEVPPQGHPSVIHVTSIPKKAKSNDVKIMFSENSTAPHSGCWGIDNVVIVNEVDRPTTLEDNFDPIDLNNWLFMPSALVEHNQCASNRNALLFSPSGTPAYVTTRDIDLSHDAPAGNEVTNMIRSGGTIGVGVCGHEAGEIVRLFNGGASRTYCTSPELDLSDKVAAKFTLSIGGGNCSRSTSHSMDVQYYYVTKHNIKHVIKNFHFDAYRTPKPVIVAIPRQAQTRGASICFAQRNHKGQGSNVWGMGSFRLVDRPHDYHYMAQFTINLACNGSDVGARVRLEYSTDLGRTWSLLQSECLPEVCPGEHWAQHSVYDVTTHPGWTRVTVPLPPAAISRHTRFRWIDESPKSTSRWGIDDVYIGSDDVCPSFCSGHGSCSSSGCRCDPHFSGLSCNVTENHYPEFLSENFNNGKINPNLFDKENGGQVGFQCGIVGSGKSLVFAGAGSRELITAPLNATNLKFLQFTILMGRHSETGTCRRPNNPGDGVLVQYSTDNAITWKFLQLVPFLFQRSPRVMTSLLPSEATVVGVQIRWSQQSRDNRAGDAVWSLDDILVTSHLFKTAYSTAVNFHMGTLQPYCNRSLVLAFTPSSVPSDNQVRYAETQALHVTAGYVLQAEILIGCDEDSEPVPDDASLVLPGGVSPDTDLQLEYSLDHGKHWGLVSHLTYPGHPSSTIMFHPASKYYSSEYKKWTRVTVVLPESTWSDLTKLRVAQYNFDQSRDSWAVDDVYVGPACPYHCRNHGQCRNGACICYPGYTGVTCSPVSPLPRGLNHPFDDVNYLKSRGWQVIGGHVVGNAVGATGWGCDAMTSENYLHFDKPHVRKLVTPDLDTIDGGEIQFYLQIGGGKCDLPTQRSNSILLQYSLDGGITWYLVQELYYKDFPKPTYVHMAIPDEASTHHTRFRWWQPENNGKDADRWSIDDVIIGERMQSDEARLETVALPPPAGALTEGLAKKIDNKGLHFILSNEGSPVDFCDPKPNSYVFNKLRGNRFIMTDDLYMRENDVIQFQLNIACSRNFSHNFAVKLEYSKDGGYSWDYVTHACYPSGRFITSDDTIAHRPEDVTSAMCTGSARELEEASKYFRGDFDRWKTIVVPAPRDVASETARFRWIQEIPANLSLNQTPPDWAISSIYIGPGCPELCSGHGLCSRGNDSAVKCICSDGYTATDDGSCSKLWPNPSGFWDKFDSGVLSPDWWDRPLGGDIGPGCGASSDQESLVFTEDGTRLAQTKPLNTRDIRLIQFDLRIGSDVTNESCVTPSGRDESVILQYSNDNGINWNLIKVFSYDSFGSGDSPRVTLDIPFKAKTPSTIFRWWQPLQHEGSPRASWSISDVIIGRNNLLSNGFYDSFNPAVESSSYDAYDTGYDYESASTSSNIIGANWYKVRGGALGKFIECKNLEVDPTKTSLVFESDQAGRFIETWDFYLLSGSFLQFDLIMYCDETYIPTEPVRLEYSSDGGKTWQLVVPQCLPGDDSSVGCKYGLGSIYYRKLHKKWLRHTVMLPESMRLSQVRFRWIQNNAPSSPIQWSLDNVYLGNQCPWMCSGRGSCLPDPNGGDFSCHCDLGFEVYPHCTANPGSLPESFRDNFNHPWVKEGNYTLVVGREAIHFDDLTSVGVIVDRENIQFSRPGVRILQTKALNTTQARYLQFYVHFQPEADRNEIIVQSSVNNGITWETLDRIEGAFTPASRLIHIQLSKTSKHPATIFRWWSTDVTAEQNEGSWALDNLVIGGRSSACDPHLVEDSFNPIHDDNWLFVSGGSVGSGCWSSGSTSLEDDGIGLRSFSNDLVDLDHVNSSIVFDSLDGEHSLVTRDLCVINNDFVIQFMIKIGCGDTKPSSRDPVQLEFTVDDGVTWHLVVPHCHSNEASPAGCSAERHQASVYYPGSFEGWRRVVVPLKGRHHICASNSVRFRWHQNKYPDHYGRTDVIPWMIDDVYIGPGCEQMCSGHGVCVNQGAKCVCDAGYTSHTCCDAIEGSNPTFFKEEFEHGQVTSSSPLWSEASGGSVSKLPVACDDTRVFLRRNYVMHDSGSRVLATRDVDTREASFVQFYLKQDGRQSLQTGDLYLSSPASQSVLFQYSTDGGLSWSLIETFRFPISTQVRYVALPLLEGARSNATRFRWWQPSKTGTFTLDWAVDDVIIGGPLSHIEDKFSAPQEESWIHLASSEIVTSDTCCPSPGGAPCRFLRIGQSDATAQDCGRREASTRGVNVGGGSYIQFTPWSECGAANTCSDLVLEYSTDLGYTWSLVAPECLPSDTECLKSHPSSSFKSDVFSRSSGSVSRVVVPLPEVTWSPETRFRWRVTGSDDVMSWNIDDVYIGNQCRRACSGRGFCQGGQCRCDSGWTGPECKTPTSDLQTDLKDVFNENYDDIASSQYDKIVGGVVDDRCGDMGFQNALHFIGNCSRLLLTKPLNTSKSDFIQFVFRFACQGSQPTNRNQGVMLEYTRNGGVTWLPLNELYYKDHVTKAGFVNVLLPDGAKDVGVSFRFRQPEHTGSDAQDWAIDNLIISGGKNDKLLSDEFVISDALTDPHGLYLDRKDKQMWHFYDNTKPTRFCGRNDVILAGVEPGRDATVGTKDFIANPGYILQYTIVVLCEKRQFPHQPVHVQYSLDFGDTWHYVTSQCLPSDPDCFVKEMTQPSAHFVGPDWRRMTYWLPEDLLKRPVRFRFHQNSSDVVWALDHFYVGPSCPDACNNHGDCNKDEDDENPRCICDEGFSGLNCYLNQTLKKYLKDIFNGSPNISQWKINEAGKLGLNCGRLSDGDSMSFDGVGPRQIVAEPIDLRDATFVEYKFTVGGNRSCLPVSDRNDGVLLQYSTDGGISWNMLHELDAFSYDPPREDYVKLPLEARTNATILRWWQPFVINPSTGLVEMGFERAGWAMDDVYIGGHEINVDDLESHFESREMTSDNIGLLPDQLFDFYPGASLGIDQCGNEDRSRDIVWSNHKRDTLEQSLTTRQLIVSSGFMIQFKIKIGCSNETNLCSKDFPVMLQYREDPSYEWQLVRHNCFTSTSPASQCVPFIHHEHSVYTLDRTHTWTRVTIPLDNIESETTQFRWYQPGGASERYSWGLDDVYIGPACPAYCTGHGMCTVGARCQCDVGYTGADCSKLYHNSHIRDFRDSFEIPGPFEMKLARAAMARGVKIPVRWRKIEGGTIGMGGCGSLRPPGFGRTVYFNGCGRRSIESVEMDLTLGGHLHYVLQIGATPPRPSCRVNNTFASGQGSVLLEYSTNNGVTWHEMVENRVGHFPRPKRVSVRFSPEMLTTHTIIRWWQPDHGGSGWDQWALDNIEIIMKRENRFLHNLDAPPPLLPSRGRVELPSQRKSKSNVPSLFLRRSGENP